MLAPQTSATFTVRHRSRSQSRSGLERPFCINRGVLIRMRSTAPTINTIAAADANANNQRAPHTSQIGNGHARISLRNRFEPQAAPDSPSAVRARPALGRHLRIELGHAAPPQNSRSSSQVSASARGNPSTPPDALRLVSPANPKARRQSPATESSSFR